MHLRIQFLSIYFRSQNIDFKIPNDNIIIILKVLDVFKNCLKFVLRLTMYNFNSMIASNSLKQLFLISTGKMQNS